VVESAGPIDGDVMAVVELDGAANGAPRVGLAETVETVEDGAVLADVEALERADLVLLRLGGDGAEEGDVVVGVEAAEVAVAGGVRAEHSHRGVRASARRLRLSPAADRAAYGRALPHKSEAVEECIRFMNSSSRKYR